MIEETQNQDLVKFQVNKGQKVLNKPDLFMANRSDAEQWEAIGVGMIINEVEVKKDSEIIDNKNNKKK